MQSPTLVRLLVSLLLASLACAGAAVAAQRTYVSVAGTDANACTVGAPCRTFDRALVMVDAGGEVIVLDSGGYGAATIGKAVSIIAPAGVYAGISVFGAPSLPDGILIAAGAGDRVVLRGLTINGQGGLRGVKITSARDVEIADCAFTGLQSGIAFQPSVQIRLAVHDTVVRDSSLGGLSALPAAAAGATSGIDIWRSVFRDNRYGIEIGDVRRASISESFVVGSAKAYSVGINLYSTAMSVENPSIAVDGVQVNGYRDGIVAWGVGSVVTVVNVSNSTVANNTERGVAADANGYVRLRGSAVTGNGTGVMIGGPSPPAGIASLGDNLVAGNTGSNSPPTLLLTPY